MLPHVLDYSAPAVMPQLAQLALRARLGEDGEDEDTLALKFLDGVRALNQRLGIPTTLEALREQDIPALAAAACKEALIGYPVPRYMDQATCEAIIRKVLPEAKPKAPAKAAAKAPAKPAAKRKSAARKAAPRKIAKPA